ncbi:sensor histidine kinase [Clostridium saudiense]|uniref:sensor histidine kinase n=1 Tax=Clostridium saudiense TaxID=1414720 RepID=UPI001FADB1AA|nr:GHKL domain-containing protein [Clostridium saudiense]
MEILSFIEYTSMLMIYHLLFIGDTDNKIKKHLLISLIGGIVSATLFIIFNSFGTVTIILILLLSLIVSCKIYEKNIIVNMVEIIIASIVLMIVEMIFTISIDLIVGHVNLSEWVYAILLIISMSLTLYSIYKFIGKREINFDLFIEKYNSILIISVNIIMIFLFFRLLIQNEFIKELPINEIGILFISIISINVFYFYDVYKKDKKKKSSEIKESMNPLIQELIDEMKANEHEYKNHLNILYCMIQVCKEDELKDKAKKYIGNVFENKNLLNNLSKVENTILKAVLLSKINQAEKNEIDCYYFIDSQLEGVPLDDSELTVVLSNLLNNAIEAASKSEKKVIEISTEYYEGKYIIEVSNSVDNLTKSMVADISKIRFSNKGTGRGYGLYNVKNIVEKYKGKVNMSLEEDIFNVLIEI